MSKYYAVKKGNNVGIYTSWDEAKIQVNGYKGAVYKSFKTHAEAEHFMDNITNVSNNVIPYNVIPYNVINNKTNKDVPNNIINNKNNIVPDNIDLLIYTDGSCKDNIGGYGVVIITIQENNNIKEYYGHLPSPCTNQIAELTAIKIALLNASGRIHIRSDSMYSIDCFTKYIKVWKRNGFMTTKKEPVKNQQLIKDIDVLMQNNNVTFEHVYSHRGEYYNEMVDRLAEKGRLQL
jgi:ribonuclease HI